MHFPQQSKLKPLSEDAYFADSFSRDISYTGESALALYVAMAHNIPAWVVGAMKLRNWVVSKLGLKDLGTFETPQKTNYKTGDRAGIFTVVENNEHELILEDRDKHLNVTLSVLVEPKGDTATVHMNTVVYVNNLWGRVYMFFVGPMHKIIVPSTLKQLTK